MIQQLGHTAPWPLTDAPVSLRGVDHMVLSLVIVRRGLEEANVHHIEDLRVVAVDVAPFLARQLHGVASTHRADPSADKSRPDFLSRDTAPGILARIRQARDA